MTNYAERGRVPPHSIDAGDSPAIAMLKEEHQTFRALFDMVETVDRRMLFPVAGEICIRLAIHMTLEEELFYPSLKPVIGTEEIDEGIVEHHLAKRLMSELMKMTGREELFRAKVHVLGEEVVRHIDEEDCELFRDARRAWEDGKVDLVVLGAQMQVRRRELFDLIDAAARDSRVAEIEPIGEAIEDLPRGAAGAHSSQVEEDA
jgi:hypothetical protein